LKKLRADPVKTKGRRFRFDELLARSISPSDYIPMDTDARTTASTINVNCTAARHY